MEKTNITFEEYFKDKSPNLLFNMKSFGIWDLLKEINEGYVKQQSKEIEELKEEVKLLSHERFRFATESTGRLEEITNLKEELASANQTIAIKYKSYLELEEKCEGLEDRIEVLQSYIGTA
jgi:chromosome segregation ATPase